MTGAHRITGRPAGAGGRAGSRGTARESTRESTHDRARKNSPAGARAQASHAPHTGLLPWIFPAMLAVPALDVLLSGRDLAESFIALGAAVAPPRPAGVDWLQRAVSLLLLAASVEQIVNHISLKLPAKPWLLAAFGSYWAGSVALPALFGAYPRFTHDLLYAPAAGLACCLASPEERDRMIRLARDTLMALMAAGLALLPLMPALVADRTYAAGLLPGLPRLAGLTPHPVTQGQLAQVALLLLWTHPYRHRLLRRGAWALGLAVLVLAQSKTAWLAFGLCAMALAAVRHGAAAWRRLFDPARSGAGLLTVCGLGLAVIVLAAAVLSGVLSEKAESFLATEQGSQLLTLTGRDRIWIAALEEWRLHPVFGYGLSLWDASYRAAIGLPQATHAHNQLLDDAARAGSVGAATLLVYAGALAALCLRHARSAGGLPMALGLTLALRAVGEVPLLLVGYGSELFTHLLLLATLAAARPQEDA